MQLKAERTRMLVVICLVVWYSPYKVAAQQDCPPCRCCKDSECPYEGSYDCENGCKDGFWGNTCMNKCSDNCLSCPQDFHHSSQYCTQCKDGYYLVTFTNETFGECRQCDTRCSTCKSRYNCLTCNNGFFNGQSTTDCSRKCPINCRSCASQTRCLTGKDQYFLEENDNAIVDGVQKLLCPSECKGCVELITCHECSDGYYGHSCQNTCNAGCDRGACFPDSGKCRYGCREGYAGDLCDSCDFEFDYIDFKCSNCTDNCADCTAKGFCTKCKDRYVGIACQTPCPDKCRSCLSDQTCNQCVNGYFGQTCTQPCPDNCLDGKCKISDGKCIACMNGFSGGICNEKCQDNCLNRACNIDGSCVSCESGFHGAYCNSICPPNCVTCTSNSSCTKCLTGYFGKTCINRCSNCLEGTTCRKQDGYCDYGCKDGWYNSDCQQQCNLQCKACTRLSHYKCTKCIDGRYGITSWGYLDCNSICSPNCLDKICDERNGSCLSGCVRGRWGKNCLEICSANCLESECYQFNGSCSLGCLNGFKGESCDCPINCECDKTGQCTSCKSGYKNVDKNCMCTTCVDEYCSKCKGTFYEMQGVCCPCKNNCKNSACVSATNCSHGCEAGYYGYDCGMKCSFVDPQCEECPITYGQTNDGCSLCKPGYYPTADTLYSYNRCKRCKSTCKDKTCDGTNGKCIQGCIERYWGQTCEENCPPKCLKCDRYNGNCLLCTGSKYLFDCSQTCSASCNRTDGDQLCEVVTGACVNGCLSPNLYGIHCDKNCSNSCKDNICAWLTGDCVKGCKSNLWGKQCEHVCNDNCKPVEGATTCNESNGHCLVGCKEGHYSVQCKKNCSINCLNTSCDTRGRCIYGCSGDFVDDLCLQVKVEQVQENDRTAATIGGLFGGVVALVIIIAAVIAVILIKRRHKKNENNQSNNAIRFSEVVEQGIQTELDDSVPVYATPDKPKVKKDTTKAHTVNNPSYQKPHIAKTQSGIEADATVYENSVQREDVKKDAKSKTGTRQLLEDLAGASDTRQSLGRYLLELEDPSENVGSSSAALVLGSGYHVKKSDEGNTYYNTAEVFKRKIPLEKLAEFVDKKTTEGFEEEFKLLPVGLIKKYTESQKKDNITKNRYRGIYPYDETRVVLRDGESNYINASYIDGYKKLRAYVASLGPTYEYMDDMSAFWRMVWQEKCGKIIMLTNLMEAGTRKCDQYWPEKDSSQLYADINVTCLSEETYADFTVRVFNIEKDSAKRTVTQVHFTAWPDQGVPDDVTCLIEFRQRVVSVKTNLDGPILVHCSAGIGRTGTYIALDSLTKEGESEGRVDINACVRNLREQRVNMIQTAEQYEYLHKAVVHSLTFDSHAIDINHFQQYMKAHDIKTLAQKFQDLEHSVEKRSKNENEAIKKNSATKDKNRTSADIPGDRNRPRLYLNLKPGASDYINALYVNSYRHVNRYILAQTPLPGTVDDFLTLVVQEKCSCIISMEPESNKHKDVGIYYPADNQTLKRGKFTVRTERVTSTQNFIHRRLTISNHGKVGTEDHTVQHFQLTSWTDGMKCPDDAASFLDFLHHVELKSGGAEAGPVLVHCLTGAEKCGLFCVVSILLEKVQCDQEVSVVNTVRQVKSRRHGVIPNQEQYIFCHQCVNEYVRSFDNYSNFASRK